MISDLQNLEDKRKVCLGSSNSVLQQDIVSSSNNVGLSIRLSSLVREVVVKYKGVVDYQVVGNCSEGWVEIKNKCLLVVTEEKSWQV